MVPALGWFERGIGKQLLLNRHGLKQWAKSVFILAARRQGCEKLSLCRGTTPRRARRRSDCASGEKDRRLMRNSRHDRNTTHHDGDSQPTQLRTKQPLQPSMMTGLVETEPPARPGHSLARMQRVKPLRCEPEQ